MTILLFQYKVRLGVEKGNHLRVNIQDNRERLKTQADRIRATI